MHSHKFWCLLNLSTVLETEKRERIFSPGDEERLWQAVMDIDNEVVICNRVDVRPWKLSIDKNSLQNKHHHPLRKKKQTENLTIHPKEKTKYIMEPVGEPQVGKCPHT